MLFITIQPDGTLTEHEVTGETYPTLSAAVEGYIEAVTYADDLVHYHNEEFLYAEGDVFGQLNFAPAVLANFRIYGPVIFTGGVDAEGETVGLSPEWASALREVAQYIRDNLDALRALPQAQEPKPEPTFTITAW